jgi:Tfp pilus assembly protein PilV
MMRGLQSSKSDGFVLLVELLLAISILMGGILAFVALLETVYETSGDADNDMETALFADSVLNGLRAGASAAAESNQWHIFWNDLRSNGVPLVTPDFWGVSETIIHAYAPDISTNQMSGRGHHSGTDNVGVDHSLRYSMAIYPDTVYGSNTPLSARVELKVWPGADGPTSNDNAVVFYSEFHNTGGL